jgi:hypothetical protein
MRTGYLLFVTYPRRLTIRELTLEERSVYWFRRQSAFNEILGLRSNTV